MKSDTKLIIGLIIAIIVLGFVFALRVTVFKDKKILNNKQISYEVIDDEKMIEYNQNKKDTINSEDDIMNLLYKVIFVKNIIFTIGLLIVLFLVVRAMWKIFETNGIPGWMIFVPILGVIKLFEIVDLSGAYALLLIIPIVNFVAAPILCIIINVRLAEMYNKSRLFGIGMMFLPFIFYPILAKDI